MEILLDVNDYKADLFLEFIKNIPFIRSSEKITSGQVNNKAILQSIEDYESGKVVPTSFNLGDLKQLIDA